MLFFMLTHILCIAILVKRQELAKYVCYSYFPLTLPPCWLLFVIPLKKGLSVFAGSLPPDLAERVRGRDLLYSVSLLTLPPLGAERVCRPTAALLG